MATLDVGLDDAFTTIRSALSAAASGDTILLDPGTFNITSTTTPAAAGRAPASFAQFGAKALSVVGAGSSLTMVVGNARIYVGQLDRNAGVPLDLNLSSIRLQYALASGYILQYGDYLFNWLSYDQGGNLYYGAANTIVGLSLNAQLQATLSTITPAQAALFNGIDQQISQTVAARVLASFQNDGSSLSFAPLQNPITLHAPAYVPVNSGPNNVTLIDQWTPEYSINSNPATPLQVYLTPTWGDVQYYLFPTSGINALTAQAGGRKPSCSIPTTPTTSSWA
jgi:hypothetical protein